MEMDEHSRMQQGDGGEGGGREMSCQGKRGNKMRWKEPKEIAGDRKYQGEEGATMEYRHKLTEYY